MYESFFDLSSRPFPAAPVVQYYFPSAVIEQARQTLIRIVDRAEGPGLIIGQPGLGKTLLLRMLDHHFQNIFHCIHLASAAIESRKDLLQNVLFELNLPYRNMEEGELRLSLLDFLRPSENCPHGVLLLVDEAHTLPLQLLDEIRMITNLVRDGQPRVRLVLAGDTHLDDIFTDPRLDSFNQRIAARCYLEPLNQEQTIEYVQAQVATIGGNPSELFTHDALVAVFRASGGIPRVINQVCDHSLVMASLGGYHQLDAAGIEEAWSDLQQLPGPWNDPTTPATESGESIVEFGSLDEDDALAAQAEQSLDKPILPLPVADLESNQLEAKQHEAAPVELADDIAEPVAADVNNAAPEETFTHGPVSGNLMTGDTVSGETVSGDTVSGDTPSTVDQCNSVSQECLASAEEPSDDTHANGQSVSAIPVTQGHADVHDPANETPIANASPQQNVPTSNACETEYPVEPAVQEIQLSIEATPAGNGLEYFDANVVQVDWKVNPTPAIEDKASSADTNLDVPPVGQAVTETHPSPEVPAPVAAVPEPEFVDPFGQGFEDEEVVVDRYADRGASVFSGCPRVASEEGRALAAVMIQQPSPQLSVVDADSSDTDVAEDVTPEPIDSVVGQSQIEKDESGAAAGTVELGAAAANSPSEELSTIDGFAAREWANNVYDTSSLSDWLFEQSTETVVADGGDAKESNASDNVAHHATTTPANAQRAVTLDVKPTDENAATSHENNLETSSAQTGEQPSTLVPPVSQSENQVDVVLAKEEQHPSFLQMHTEPSFNDDRDMIVIDHDKSDGVFLTQSGDDLARRVEYQQLFSQLRES